MRKLSPSLPAAAAAAMLALAPANMALAGSNSGIETGILVCHSVAGGINLIIHSVTNIRCTFTSTDKKVIEKYRGETGIGLGIDLNWKREETIAFTVVTVSSDIRPGNYFLAGKYLGVKANVTLGVGGGAASLVGGGKNGIGLQPLALETSKGLAISGGIGYLYLEPDR